MEQIVRNIWNCHRILLASHENPDGDAIGALLALGLFLESLGKKITMYNASPIPAVYNFLPCVDTITSKLNSVKSYDAAIILDCGNMGRLGEMADKISRIPVIINIDHHITNTLFGTCHLVDPEACASAALVFHLINEMGGKISKDIATCIYTGILTDTGSFRFSNTKKRTFSICEDLMSCGVEPFEVARHVYGTYSLGRIKLLNMALESIEISKNGQLSFMTLTQKMLKETGTHPEDADGVINYARRIEDIKIAVLIQELEDNHPATYSTGSSSTDSCSDDKYHVSLRSNGTIDVAKIAMAFGGGGHINASGFTTKARLGELKNMITEMAGRNSELCIAN